MRLLRLSRNRLLVLGVGVLAMLVVHRAGAGHHHHCDGEWSGYLFDEGGDEQEADCYSWGDWHVTIDTDDGEFNFHFHGKTSDRGCFNQHEHVDGYCPQWVAYELYEECGACIEEVDYTHYDIDHKGNVFLKVKGIAYDCSDNDEGEE